MSDQVNLDDPKESGLSRDLVVSLSAIAYELVGQDAAKATQLLAYTLATAFRAAHTPKHTQLELFGATIDDIELDAKRFPSFYGDPATRVN